jgi:hypothetical protein
VAGAWAESAKSKAKGRFFSNSDEVREAPVRIRKAPAVTLSRFASLSWIGLSAFASDAVVARGFSSATAAGTGVVTSAAVAKAPRVRAEHKTFFIMALLMAKEEMDAFGLALQSAQADQICWAYPPTPNQ